PLCYATGIGAEGAGGTKYQTGEPDKASRREGWKFSKNGAGERAGPARRRGPSGRSGREGGLVLPGLAGQAGFADNIAPVHDLDVDKAFFSAGVPPCS